MGNLNSNIDIEEFNVLAHEYIAEYAPKDIYYLQDMDYCNKLIELISNILHKNII